MGVRRFEDLAAWQLAFELQREVFALTAYGPAWHDIKFREQIRDASASAPGNIAEGFGRYRPREFARFLEIARGSLQETKSHLHDGLYRTYFSPAEHARLIRLAERALGASIALLRYLKHCPPDRPETPRPSMKPRQ
jgi:four helix bundle protein